MIRATRVAARSFLSRDILRADDEAQATDQEVVVAGGAGLLPDRPGVLAGPQVRLGDGDPESGGSVAGRFPVEPAIQVAERDVVDEEPRDEFSGVEARAMGLRRGGAGAVWFKLGDFQRERDHLSGDGGPGPRALERGPFRRGRGEVVAEVIAEVPEAGFEPSPRVGGPDLPAGTVAGAGELSELWVLEAQFHGGGFDEAEEAPFFGESEQTAGGGARQMDDGAAERDRREGGVGRVHAR